MYLADLLTSTGQSDMKGGGWGIWLENTRDSEHLIQPVKVWNDLWSGTKRRYPVKALGDLKKIECYFVKKLSKWY